MMDEGLLSRWSRFPQARPEFGWRTKYEQSMSLIDQFWHLSKGQPRMVSMEASESGAEGDAKSEVDSMIGEEERKEMGAFHRQR